MARRQIEGLNNFLGKEYSNLINVDVVCHGIPSPLVWKKYLELQYEKYGKDIKNILFRDKHYGYKYSTMTIKNSLNKNIYSMGVESDPMLRAFFSDICDRPSCYQCIFKKRYRVSDFTIWDCFSVCDFNKKMDDDKGTTKVLIHSEKGKNVFEDIKDTVKWMEVSSEKLVEGVKEMTQSVKMNERREQFFLDLNSMNADELFKKYFPNNTKSKLERIIRLLCYKLGIYSLAKKVYFNIRGELI